MSQVKDIGVATNNGFAKIKEMYYKKDADTFEKLVLPEVERVDANPFIVDVPFPVKENEKFTVGVEATTTKGDISYITWELESVNDTATDGLGLLVPKDYDGKATEDVVYIMQPDNKTTIFTEPGTITAIDTLSNIGQVKDSVPLMTATEYGIAKPDGTTCIINDAGELVCIDTVGNVDPVQPTITDQMVIDRITDQMVIDRITDQMVIDRITEKNVVDYLIDKTNDIFADKKTINTLDDFSMFFINNIYNPANAKYNNVIQDDIMYIVGCSADSNYYSTIEEGSRQAIIFKAVNNNLHIKCDNIITSAIIDGFCRYINPYAYVIIVTSSTPPNILPPQILTKHGIINNGGIDINIDISTLTRQKTGIVAYAMNRSNYEKYLISNSVNDLSYIVIDNIHGAFVEKV